MTNTRQLGEVEEEEGALLLLLLPSYSYSICRRSFLTTLRSR
jgi:hypothetical protein